MSPEWTWLPPTLVGLATLIVGVLVYRSQKRENHHVYWSIEGDSSAGRDQLKELTVVNRGVEHARDVTVAVDPIPPRLELPEVEDVDRGGLLRVKWVAAWGGGPDRITVSWRHGIFRRRKTWSTRL